MRETIYSDADRAVITGAVLQHIYPLTINDQLAVMVGITATLIGERDESEQLQMVAQVQAAIEAIVLESEGVPFHD